METQAFSLKDYPFDKANALVLKTLFPSRRSIRFLRLAVMIILGLSVGLVTGRLQQPVWVTVSVMLNLAMALIFIENWYTARKTFATIDRTPTLSGLPQVKLTEAGLQLTGQLGESLTRWGGIRDLIPGPDGWIILLTGSAYIPLPSAAFTSPAEAEAFTSALRARIPVVKEPF